MTLAANPPDLVFPTIEAMRAFFTEFPTPGAIASALNSCGKNSASTDGVLEKFQAANIGFSNSGGMAYQLEIDPSEEDEFHGVMGEGNGSGDTRWETIKNVDPGPNRLAFSCYSDGGFVNRATMQGSSDISDGVTRHFFQTFSPAVAPANGLNIYENGVLDNALPSTGGTGFQGFSAAVPDLTISNQKEAGGDYGKQIIGRIAYWLTHKPDAGEVAEWQAMESSCTNIYFGESSAEEIRRRGLYLFDGGHR